MILYVLIEDKKKKKELRLFSNTHVYWPNGGDGFFLYEYSEYSLVKWNVIMYANIMVFLILLLNKPDRRPFLKFLVLIWNGIQYFNSGHAGVDLSHLSGVGVPHTL